MNCVTILLFYYVSFQSDGLIQIIFKNETEPRKISLKVLFEFEIFEYLIDVSDFSDVMELNEIEYKIFTSIIPITEGKETLDKNNNEMIRILETARILSFKKFDNLLKILISSLIPNHGFYEYLRDLHSIIIFEEIQHQNLSNMCLVICERFEETYKPTNNASSAANVLFEMGFIDENHFNGLRFCAKDLGMFLDESRKCNSKDLQQPTYHFACIILCRIIINSINTRARCKYNVVEIRDSGQGQRKTTYFGINLLFNMCFPVLLEDVKKLRCYSVNFTDNINMEIGVLKNIESLIFIDCVIYKPAWESLIFTLRTLSKLEQIICDQCIFVVESEALPTQPTKSNGETVESWKEEPSCSSKHISPAKRKNYTLKKNLENQNHICGFINSETSLFELCICEQKKDKSALSSEEPTSKSQLKYLSVLNCTPGNTMCINSIENFIKYTIKIEHLEIEINRNTEFKRLESLKYLKELKKLVLFVNLPSPRSMNEFIEVINHTIAESKVKILEINICFGIVYSSQFKSNKTTNFSVLILRGVIVDYIDLNNKDFYSLYLQTVIFQMKETTSLPSNAKLVFMSPICNETRFEMPANVLKNITNHLKVLNISVDSFDIERLLNLLENNKCEHIILQNCPDSMNDKAIEILNKCISSTCKILTLENFKLIAPVIQNINLINIKVLNIYNCQGIFTIFDDVYCFPKCCISLEKIDLRGSGQFGECMLKNMQKKLPNTQIIYDNRTVIVCFMFKCQNLFIFSKQSKISEVKADINLLAN